MTWLVAVALALYLLGAFAAGLVVGCWLRDGEEKQ